MPKLMAVLISLVTIAAVLSVMGRYSETRPRDSFPLSHYPMFSTKRPDVATVHHAVGIDMEGQYHPIPTRFVGSGGMNTIRKQIRKIVRSGRQRSQQLCLRIAKNIAQDSSKALGHVVRLQIITGRYSIKDYYRGQTQPLVRQVHSTCDIPKGEK